MQEKPNSIREVENRLRYKNKEQKVNYKNMTAPCGLPCFECNMHLALESEELRNLLGELFNMPSEQIGCKGCRDEDGKCAHLPVECNLYPCVKEKGLHNYSECNDFPCDLLHPFYDNTLMWHNTKAYNLCLIKKMGLEEWGKNKAANVLDMYTYGKWKL